MHASLRPLVASLGLFSAATLVADVAVVWTGTADDQFSNPANWRAVYVPATNSAIAADSAHLQLAILASAVAGAGEDSTSGGSFTTLTGNTTFTDPVTVGD